MRKSSLFLSFISISLALFLLMFIHASLRKKAEMRSLIQKYETVKQLRLTDLCLFTEASYTRHLSQADLHTAFKDHPASLEHFPSGSLLAPPPMIKRMNENID
jgi:hypothetical protein